MDSKTINLSKYDAKYDIIKFVLSIMVLAIHSVLYPMILYPWLRISVPLFFIMSSYFVFSKLCKASKNNHKKIIKNFVCRNLQLYLCWFVILLPITIYIRHSTYFSNGFLKNLWNILRSVIFGSTFVASWFIISTVIGVLIVYLLSKLLKKDFIVFVICLISFCLITIASSYTSVIEGTILDIAIKKYIDIFGSLVCSFPTAIFWVFVGKMFAERKINIKPIWLIISLIIVCCVALWVEWKFVISLDNSYNNDSYFMLAPLCIFIFSGIQRIKPLYWKNSAHFKRLSTIIYVVHGSILPIITTVLSAVLKLENALLSFVITLLCCFLVYIIIRIIVGNCHSEKIQGLCKLLY